MTAELNRSLSELTNIEFVRDDSGSSLARRVRAACDVPIGQLDPGRVALLIRQDVGRDHVIRRALDILQQDPLIEAQVSRGDLLRTVLDLPHEFWTHHEEDYQTVHQILMELDEAIDELTPSRASFASFLS